MLKIYSVKSMFQINRQRWQPCGTNGYVCLDEDKVQAELINLDHCSFDEAYQKISELHPDGLDIGETIFRHRPYITIGGWNAEEQERFYAGKVHTISHKDIYREKKYVTLDWISSHLTADEAIQYFKERGMTVRPIMYN